MAAYNIYEAKTKFSALVEKASAGEEVIISKAGKPLLKLVPVDDSSDEKKHKRPGPGAFGDDFSALIAALDEPWSEEEQRAFGMID
jgi:prevent-host-death family protein